MPLLSHTRILVAEDNLNVRNILQVALKNSNYDVMLATNGQEAVKAARSHSPQLILMDLMLPGLNGIDAARLIRKNPKMRSVPIVAITTAFNPQIRKKCLESGFDDFFSSPFSVRNLKAIIERSLKRRSMRTVRIKERQASKPASAWTFRKRYFEQHVENTKPRQQFVTPTKSIRTKKCPSCGSGNTRRSHRRNLWERSLSLVGSYPFRCNLCGYRFFVPGR